MKKPNDWDKVNVGDYEPVELGPHIAIIKEVKEQMTRNGLTQLVVYIDFDKTDKQAGYFAKKYKEDTREDKKWPYQGVHYILETDADGNTTKGFKQFITAWQNSNLKEFNWTLHQLKNTTIGVNFGEEDDEWQGQVRTKRRIRWFFNVAKIDEQKIPEKKPLSTTTTTTAAPVDDFMNIPDGSDELPFR